MTSATGDADVDAARGRMKNALRDRVGLDEAVRTRHLAAQHRRLDDAAPRSPPYPRPVLTRCRAHPTGSLPALRHRSSHQVSANWRPTPTARGNPNREL
jgi:hypothetical protein